ncbi:hypothetical protein D3C72_2473100 [compost metagenome]
MNAVDHQRRGLDKAVQRTIGADFDGMGIAEHLVQRGLGGRMVPGGQAGLAQVA